MVGRQSPSLPTTPKKKRIVDRYIPKRDGVSLHAAYSLAGETKSNMKMTSEDIADETYSEVLKAELFSSHLPNSSATLPPTPSMSLPSSSPDRKPPASARRETQSLPTTPRKNRNLFTFSPSKRPVTAAPNEVLSSSPVRLDSQRFLLSPRRMPREVDSTPFKALNAPYHADDFYLNLVEWGSNDMLAVGLGPSVFLWSRETETVEELCNIGDDDRICSVSWVRQGTHLAVGTNSGAVQIWDVATGQRTRHMTGHVNRVPTLAWNSHILTSGSADCSILHRDVRIADPYIKRLVSHTAEVCGLRWNADLDQLASGANDDCVKVWSGLDDKPLYDFTEYTGAVKAIAWSPYHRGLLATGGGKFDCRLMFWNTLTGQKQSEFNTGSQVCNLVWSTKTREIITSHGFHNYEVAIWKYPSMERVASLTGHQSRVLSLSLSNDGQVLASGAGDETVRLWNVFKPERSRDTGSSLNICNQLR